PGAGRDPRRDSIGGALMAALLTEVGPALPEGFLAVAILVLLLLGVAGGGRRTPAIVALAVLALVATGWIIVSGPMDGRTTFGGMFVADGFGAFVAILILAGSALSLIVSPQYLQREKAERPEFAVLVLLATLGMLMMVTAADFLSLYV